MDFRTVVTHILNSKLLDCGFYLNLPNEEWALKIMTNLLINHGIDSSINEKRKDEWIQAS